MAVYLWSCTPEGRYSLYSKGVTDQNYLRGVQAADADGWVTFTTIFPACYDGRWPHLHFEVYPVGGRRGQRHRHLADGDARGRRREVYAAAGYEESKANLAKVSLETTGVRRRRRASRGAR